MKLGAKRLTLISFMLFSLFFGAGNLIFPPFLGQNAGEHTAVAFLGFFITAVVLPVLGVIVVSKFNGLESLGRLVGGKFAIIFTLLIYLSIGPGLGIPRAASVPFEMAVAPYLPNGSNLKAYMALYSFIFFAIALWLCLTPGKLVKRIGTFLTPSLLILLVVMFIAFLVNGKTDINGALGEYENNAFLQGFCDGYQTMDAIAALNFGLVISTTLTTFGVDSKKGVQKYTIISGVIAGSILTFVYFMLAFIGAQSSGIYAPDGNGAVLLRLVVKQLFGEPGAILLAAIFTLACLTTCVGLINSISSYFSTLFKKVSYRWWVVIITVLSFLICNLGLNTILSISVPVLNIVYPISIMLIFFGLTNRLWDKYRLVYPAAIVGTAVVSILHSLSQVFKFGAFGEFLNKLPLFKMGFFWVIVVAVIIPITMLCYLFYNISMKKKLAVAGVPNDVANEVSTDNVSLDSSEVESSDDAKEGVAPSDASVEAVTCDALDEADGEETLDESQVPEDVNGDPPDAPKFVQEHAEESSQDK